MARRRLSPLPLPQTTSSLILNTSSWNPSYSIPFSKLFRDERKYGIANAIPLLFPPLPLFFFLNPPVRTNLVRIVLP